ncbi:hypothetical protein [Mycobacterium talmoniae]|uniref:Transcriptional regulator n=1 Tax=Mycobacterium talmoniae TaxID=1858794 RepID=A0A1S1NCT8_9MYCO|nr:MULTISPECIES: hypothetical protein [Mycobacterium]OHV03430.1 hypothetical protein BKN37_15030 [Mycobacterium talmoniae]PQM47296.1 hypothetical protein C1Y40_02530 [Mycobacterium talmoniae]TDH54702.1 hypothetical protein E2F47_10895 [Mycobacterium eburneum]
MTGVIRLRTAVGILGAAMLVAVIGPGSAHAEPEAPPDAWVMAGSSPADYEFERMAETVDGNAVLRLRAVNDKPAGFGTMMQTMAPTRFLGTRMRMSGLLKGNDINGWAGLWLRVDSQRGGAPLAFDNMYNRPVRGSTGWSSAEIVLDVGRDASAIAFGVLLDGTGSVDISKLRFEKVGSDVPVTGRPQN